jgi:hypothetical protein
MPRGFELVEAKPGHDPTQERLRLAYLVAIDIEPAQERLLDHVLGVRDRTQHPVGNTDQEGTQRVEARRRVQIGQGRRHHHLLCQVMT